MNIFDLNESSKKRFYLLDLLILTMYWVAGLKKEV